MRGSRSPALTRIVRGDPVTVGPAITTLEALWREVGLVGGMRGGLLALAPEVVLLHALVAGDARTELRWVDLPHAPRLPEQAEPVQAAVVLCWSLADSGETVTLVARLRACLADPVRRAAARAATTREELLRALAAVEEGGRESVLGADEVLALLATSASGLAAAEAQRRRQAVGPNRLERVRRRPLVLRFVEQFWSFFALLLWVGGFFAFLARMPELGWAIFAVIVVNGVFSFLQEYRAERALEALEDLLPHQIAVLRGGVATRIATTVLVPGDVVCLEEGDQVPADGQLLEAAGLRLDQGALTGESHPVFKLPAIANDRGDIPLAERHELVFAGTGVVAGTGTFVVRAIGMATEIGAIARLTQTVAEEPSPLQREMARVTRIVTALAVSFGVSFFVLGVLGGALPPTEGFVFALGVIVANVPEGLLPTLTLALALGVQRMARRRCLVRRLSAVETLGATTVVCTDKTGTLTENRMAARSVWWAGRTWTMEELTGAVPGGVRELFEVAALASQATPEHGDPTEVALVGAGVVAGVDPVAIRSARPLLAPYPFDSFRKRMTLVRAGDDGAIACVKGAPKETLALCTAIRWHDAAVPLTEAHRRAVTAEHDRLAGEGLRLLAVAVRALVPELVGAPAGVVERELVFLGLVALWDPPRGGVADAVALCRRAGIRVVMVTGDDGLTACAIARRIGLRVERVVLGEEVGRLPPDVLRGLVAEPGILFARTSPAHKLAIVEQLHALGEVVAVTGDGVNDAPALKAADIGVAMGRRGSEVAKEAAVMVLTDDDFASIVVAVRAGRAIWANMGKFVTYIFASNVPELVPFLLFVFVGIPLPLTIMQILAVDLGTDLLPALALGAEPAEPGVMSDPPRPRTERLLGAGRLLHAYGFLGMLEATLALAAFFWTYHLAGWSPGLPLAAAGPLYRRATTMTLAGIVAAQVGNVFACRTERESVFRVGLCGNRLVLVGIVAEVALLITLIVVPPLARLFGLEPLGVAEWGLLLAFPPTILLSEEARKLVGRMRRPAGSRDRRRARESGRA